MKKLCTCLTFVCLFSWGIIRAMEELSYFDISDEVYAKKAEEWFAKIKFHPSNKGWPIRPAAEYEELKTEIKEFLSKRITMANSCLSPLETQSRIAIREKADMLREECRRLDHTITFCIPTPSAVAPANDILYFFPFFVHKLLSYGLEFCKSKSLHAESARAGVADYWEKALVLESKQFAKTCLGMLP